MKRIAALATLCLASLTLLGCPLPTPSGPDGRLYSSDHNFDRAQKIEQLPDGSFLVSGETKLARGFDYLHVFAAIVTEDRATATIIDYDMPLSQSHGARRQLVTAGPPGSFYVAGSTKDSSGGSPQGNIRVQRRNYNGEKLFDEIIPLANTSPLEVTTDSQSRLWINSLSAAASVYTNYRTQSLLTIDAAGTLVQTVPLVWDSPRLQDIEFVGENHLAFGSNIYPSGSNRTDVAVSIFALSSTALTEHTFDFESRDDFEELVVAPNGDILMVLQVGDRAQLVRTNPAGETIWARSDMLPAPEDRQDSNIWDAVFLPDGRIAVVGESGTYNYVLDFFPAFSFTQFIALLDADGNLLWRTNLRMGAVHGLTHTRNGTLVACGISQDSMNLVEVDLLGRVLN